MDLEQSKLLAAKTDDRVFEELIEQNKSRILRCASQTVGRYVTESDDEWSIALLAFHEAVQSYTPEKGSFHALAALIIRRRLVDDLRKADNRSAEISVSPEVFSGARADENTFAPDHSLYGAVIKKTVELNTTALAANARAEIAEMQTTLKAFGFSFFDVAKASPKAEKTKAACAIAIRTLLDSEELMQMLRTKRVMPIRELSRLSGVHKKILERHRKYIIAAANILDGDFPILSSYLRFVRKE